MSIQYQFHAAPFVVFGRDSRKNIGSLLKKWGATGNVLLVHGKNILKSGLAVDIAKSITEAGMTVRVFDRVLPDAPVEAVREGIAFAKEEAITAIVSIGGGSAMDLAKAIAVMLNHPGDILEYAGMDRLTKPRQTLLFAVPTTCGTGSEITDGGVVYDAEKQYKFPIWDAALAPDVAILDPYMLSTLSPRMIAATAMDAMAHSVEAYTSRGANPISDALALGAVELLAKNIAAAYAGENPEALELVFTASTMAGMAFNRSGVHAGHAIAHAIGALSHVHHGTACALTLPYVVGNQAKALPEKVAKLGAALGITPAADASPAEIGSAVAQGFAELNRSLGMVKLSDYGVTAQMLDSIVAYAMAEAIGQRAHVPSDAESLKAYLISIL